MPRQSRRSRVASTPRSSQVPGRAASPPAYRAQSVPATRPAASVPAPAAPAANQPSMFQNMAATAAGVAAGSAVGHVVGHAVTGGFGSNAAAAYPDNAEVPVGQYSAQQGATSSVESGSCAFEIRQFVECAQNQPDITLCQGFNEALRQCRLSSNASL